MTDDEPVTGPDTSTEAKAEPDAPEKTYDELLEEFDPKSEPVPEPKQPEPDSAQEVAALRAEVKKLGEQVSSASMSDAFDKTVEKFRESDSLKGFSDRTIKGWINERCREDPRINEAYGTPSWENVQRKMISEMESEFPNQSDPEDREAAEAAARGVSTSAPPTPERKSVKEEIAIGFGGSDADWEKYKQSFVKG